MAKVYAFPVKKEIPEDMMQRLDEIAKTYVQLLNDVYDELIGTAKNSEEMNEVTELLLVAYFDSVRKAVDELDEG